MKQITVSNLCNGEFERQVNDALKKVGKNIEKHGADATHQIDIQIHFALNQPTGYWEHDCRTTVSARLRESQIGSKCPMRIKNGTLMDSNIQQELPIE